MSYLPFLVHFGKFNVTGAHNAIETSIAVSGQTIPTLTVGTLPQYAVWWDSGTYQDPGDDPQVEIVLITYITGSTLTVTRGQCGVAASTKSNPDGQYKIMPVPTAVLRDLIEAKLIGCIASDFRVRLSGNTSALPASTNNVIPFNTRDHDRSSEWNTSTYKFVALKTTTYAFHMSLYVLSPQADKHVQVYLMKNGSVEVASNLRIVPTDTADFIITVDGEARLTAGDYVQGIFWHDSDAAKVVAANTSRTFMTGHALYGGV